MADVDGSDLPVHRIGVDEIAALRQPFGAAGEAVDVVVFAAPQLSLVEMGQLASLCIGRKRAISTD